MSMCGHLGGSCHGYYRTTLIWQVMLLWLLQIELMSCEIEKLTKQQKVLDRENSNLKARERHGNVTGGRGTSGSGGQGGGALEADKKKMNDLMVTVEQLQTENAVSRTSVIQTTSILRTLFIQRSF